MSELWKRLRKDTSKARKGIEKNFCGSFRLTKFDLIVFIFVNLNIIHFSSCASLLKYLPSSFVLSPTSLGSLEELLHPPSDLELHYSSLIAAND